MLGAFPGKTHNDKKLNSKFADLLYQITRAIIQTGNSGELFLRLHSTFKNYFTFESFYIALSEENGKITLPFLEDIFTDTANSTGHSGFMKNIAGYSINTGESVHLSKNDINELKAAGKIKTTDERVVEWVGIPLKSNLGNFRGVMAFQNYSGKMKFRNDDIKNLSLLSTLIADAADKKTQDELIKENKDKFKLIYLKNPLMIFILSGDGEIIDANERISDELGYEPAELIGKSITSVCLSDDENEVTGKIKESLRDKGKLQKWELRQRHKNGNIVWVRGKTCKLNENKGGKNLLLVCKNITGYKEILNKLNRSEE